MTSDEPTTLHPGAEHLETLLELRRDLHAHPELGYEETRTAARVAERLRTAGLDVTTGIARTGVVGVLDGEAGPGPTRAWRADMDALPIVEETGAEYASTCDGVMHACGHDVHTTVGVGAAELLARHRGTLDGRVVFVFQPNEEGAPGAGPSGADAMVSAGVLDDFGIESMLAIHCMPSLEVGRIGYTPGGVWAASDRFEITLRGTQTHGAYPHLGVDPIVTAGQLIGALQTIPSRVVDTQEACIVSVCQIHGGNQFNVIPGEVELEGIVRTLDEDVRARALDAVRRVAEGTAAANGCRVEVGLHRGAELTANDPVVLSRVVELLSAGLGADRVVQIPAQMGAEDFASFSRAVPSAYMLLGVRSTERGVGHEPLHSPRFDVDERCIATGVEAAATALAGLGG